MRNSFLVRFFALVLLIGTFSCEHISDSISDSLSEARMVEALQEALVLGSKTAAANLGDTTCSLAQCATGYLKNELVEIALPDTIKNVLGEINRLTSAFNSLPGPVKSAAQTNLGATYTSFLNLGNYGDSIKVALNRGAERAAPASEALFKEAILGMSISDAKSVLLGDSTAATSYLNTKTYSGLQEIFNPFISKPLKDLGLDEYWGLIASNYNSFASAYSSVQSELNLIASLNNSTLPSLIYSSLEEDISESLASYATSKALDGLFLMVGDQETKLRKDPWGTVREAGNFITDSVGDLLGDVFSKAKENLI